MNIAIDIGTDRTRLYVEGKGKILDEASVVTYDIDTREIYAIGNDAYNMIGKTPIGIKAVHPLNGGVISNSELVENMVSIMAKRLSPIKITKPKIITSISNDVTEVEKRAIVNAVCSFGAKKVFLIESPKAAAIGCGIDITSSNGYLVANIGSGKADIAVITLGGTAVSKTIRKAGISMDEDIIKYLRNKYGLIIGINMAERCKKEIGCVKEPPETLTYLVKGRDSVSGLPRAVEVTSTEIKDVIFETANIIAKGIQEVLEKTPPELAGDISANGIILTGGLVKLYGFAQLIGETTKIKVLVHKTPAECVINGCGKAIEYISEAEKHSPKGTTPILEIY
ncbi:MAG: rod shape-determining protein [Ruminococcus sp.]|nr:rod shape-determining protein [Ruminococcus sp.]